MTDKWGNEWDDDAVPSGIEIAHVMLEIRRDHGWSEMWSDYAGLRICPRVRVWLDGYQDLDYHESFLLRVYTDTKRDGLHVTTADHLAVYVRHTDPFVTWRQQPRLFFDAGFEWLFDGIRWWVDHTQAEAEYQPTDSGLSDEHLAAIAAHNAATRQRDRDNARQLGIVLPYFTEPKGTS